MSDKSTPNQQIPSNLPQQGRLAESVPPGTSTSDQRASFNDPVPGDIDPTAPDSPEQTLSYQHDRDGVEKSKLDGANQTPQQNIEDWRRQDTHEGA